MRTINTEWNNQQHIKHERNTATKAGVSASKAAFNKPPEDGPEEELKGITELYAEKKAYRESRYVPAAINVAC